MKKLMGIDIGGTKCAVLLAEAGAFSDVRFIEKTAFPTDAEKGFNHTREKIFSAVTALTEKYGAGNISAIGVCCGSPLDSRRGVIKSPPNLPGWDNIPITQMLYDCFGIPAYLQNDANACALAEWRLGAGRGAENMIFLTMGTGFGAGIIAHGKIIEGKDGLCGEIGHVRLAPDGPEGYGKSGSAEGFCSGGGIAKLALIMADRWEAGGDAPVWINEKDDMDAKRLAEYAANGDRHAVAVYEKAGE
ncbi:MAG: ROK family protein, partial [Clostridiales bacterium]|nr:ROK family protein [Clostridiales bacterium]